MNLKIINHLVNLNKFFLYDNVNLNRVLHNNYTIVRINFYYLHYSLFKFSIINNKDIGYIKKLYYIYILNKTSKDISSIHIDMLNLKLQKSKNAKVIQELFRQKRVINKLINIYSIERDDSILSNLIKRYKIYIIVLLYYLLYIIENYTLIKK